MAYLNAIGVVIQIVMTLKSILIKIKIAFETLYSGMHTQVHENKHKSQLNVLHAWSCHFISSTSPSSSLVSTTEACRLPSPTYTNEQWHQHTASATLSCKLGFGWRRKVISGTCTSWCHGHGPSFCLSLKSFISTWCAHTHTHTSQKQCNMPCHINSSQPKPVTNQMPIPSRL